MTFQSFCHFLPEGASGEQPDQRGIRSNRVRCSWPPPRSMIPEWHRSEELGNLVLRVRGDGRGMGLSCIQGAERRVGVADGPAEREARERERESKEGGGEGGV